MINGIFAAAVGFASLTAIASAGAGTPPPDLRPQWLHAYADEVYAQDRIDARDGPAWMRMANGDIVMFTVTEVTGYVDALLARRFAADGALLLTRLIGPSATHVVDYSRIIARPDPISGDIVVMIGNQYNTSGVAPCRLLRFDAAFDLKSSTLLGETTPYSKACVSMHVLADGSAVAADDYGLSRIDIQGNIVWTVRNGDDGRYLSPNDMLVDNAGTVWVASQGSFLGAGNGGNLAAVLRFGLDGQRLSEDYFLCTDCIASKASTLDLLDNGEVTVGGDGSFGRYAADGSRLLLTNIEPRDAYSNLAHDDDGATYVLATTQFDTQVRRLDSETGAVLWTQPANDFTAAAHGIVVTRRSATDVIALGIDAAGTTHWSRVLASTNNAFITHAERVGSHVELLVKSFVETPDCGRGPKLIALDAVGNLEIVAQACVMPTSTFVGSLDVLPRKGVLMNTRKLLSAYTPDGDLRWQASICAYCSKLEWLTAALSPSGGAWALKRDVNSDLYMVDRFDDAGQPIASLPVDLHYHSYFSFRLLAGENQTVVLSMYFQQMFWQRVRLRAVGVDTQIVNLPRPSHFNSVRKLINGAITMVLAGDGCQLCPLPPFFALARLAPNGSLAWMYQVPEGNGVAALDDRGGANIVVGDLEHFYLRHVDASGQPQADIVLAGIDRSMHTVQELLGPQQDRLLLVTRSYPDGTTLWSIDTAGSVLARRDLERTSYGLGIDDAQPGFLITGDWTVSSGSDLIDPVTLQTLATFRFDDTPYVEDRPNTKMWRILDNGTVFGTDYQNNTSGLLQARVARFTAPGSAQSKLIFRDEFD